MFIDLKGVKMANNRTRNYAFILYPEELPSNYCELLESLKVPMCISPLHDPDSNNINPEEQRKKHKHTMLAFDSVKSLDQVIGILYNLFGNKKGWSNPIAINSPKAMIRYFIHADNPEKQQFKDGWRSLCCFNGFELDNFIIPSSSEKSMYINQMMDYIVEHNINELDELYDVARQFYYDSWFYLLNNSSLNVISKYIDSRRYKKRNAEFKEEIQSIKNRFAKLEERVKVR